MTEQATLVDGTPGPTYSAEVSAPRERGCLARLAVGAGLFVLLFPFALVANVTEDLGGVWAWFGILGDVMEADGRLPGGEGGLVLLVGLVALVAAWIFAAVVSVLNLLLQSLTAVVVASIQTVILIYVGGAVVDVVRLRGRIARHDPRYLRKWKSRGALVAAALWTWVCLVVPFLSQLGDHPTSIPTAGHALSVAAWAGVLAVALFGVIGRLLRRKPEAGASR